MKVYFDIEQRTNDWYLLKHGKIGGTLSDGLWVKTDTLFYDLLAKKTEPYDLDEVEEGYMSEDMFRGQLLEPQAREELSKYTGIDFLEAGWIQSDIEILGISPDGISADLTAQCEIKCPSAKKHLRTCIEDIIPLDNVKQCVHAFAVNPRLENFYFMSYRPESPKPIFVKHLTLQSMVNVGTKAKPVLKSVDDCAKFIRKEALDLEQQLKNTINILSF